jgi:adenine-specific DNA-methyltransferase
MLDKTTTSLITDTISSKSDDDTPVKESLNDSIKIVGRINNIPTTRYYGSKRRIVNWIYENLKDISFNTVLDGFGGTASISLLFKAMQKSVTYNDILVSNTVSARALLIDKNPVNQVVFEKFLTTISPEEGVISRNFNGLFFTDNENLWLDGAVKKIQTLEKNTQNIFLYCLFQSCLKKRPFNLFHRANLNLRVNDIDKRSFGNLTTWNTSFETHMKTAFKEINSSIWNSEMPYSVLNAGNICDVKNGFDLVYLDPPYMGTASVSDDYMRKYHFLEGMTLYNEWLQNIDFTSKSLSFKPNPELKKWHKRESFQQLLFDLVEYHKNSVVVLSYVSDAYPSIEALLKHFNQTFSFTVTASKEISKALSKIKRKEVLVIGLP